jgi:hypothetical protein
MALVQQVRQRRGGQLCRTRRRLTIALVGVCVCVCVCVLRCSVEKKPFYPLFLLAGFQSFDGEFAN